MEFAITLSKGVAWEAAKPRRSHTGWNEHAHFMVNLTDIGFVLLEGRLAMEKKYCSSLLPLNNSVAPLRNLFL